MSKSQEYPAPAPATSRTRLFLLATWAVLTAALIAFVATLGTNCPNADEWGFVPALTGNEPLGPWLWAQHNEHRLPLPRLVYYCLFRLTHDFRAGCFFQVGLLSATSLALMAVAARCRGRPHWADLFFPVSLLHAGHWENLLIGYNICFAMILVLETAIGVIALATRESALRSGAKIGILLVLLCLCGGGGVVAAMPVAIWLVFMAIREWKSRVAGAKASRSRAAILLAFAAFPLVYLAVYLQGYHRPGHHPELGEGGFAVVRVTGEVLAMAFGPAAARSWILVAAGIVVLGFLTAFGLLRNRKSEETRRASLGLLAVMAGIIGVALTIGLSRAGIDARNGLSSRYAYLTWPLLALAYLFWAQRGGWCGKWFPAGLCLAAAVAYPSNMFTGLMAGADIHRVLGEVEADAQSGLPPEIIVRRFDEGKMKFQKGQEQRAIRAMPMLKTARIGAFAEEKR